jgi:hypothetical protein
VRKREKVLLITYIWLAPVVSFVVRLVVLSRSQIQISYVDNALGPRR